MKFTVVWQPMPEKQLANLWTGSPDRASIAKAADTIDYLLAKDPLNQGESRLDKVRILIVAPLAVLYEVSEDDCLVAVLNVWRIADPA